MRMLNCIHAGCGEVAKVDVARAFQGSIRSIGTMGTHKHLVSSESMMQQSTCSARLARVRFVDDFDMTPRKDTRVVDQACTKAKVCNPIFPPSAQRRRVAREIVYRCSTCVAEM